MSIEVLPLGAGQDVGRSCCVVRMAGRTVMFDCGAHFGFRDARRFPEFGLLSRAGRFTDIVDALVITHFHTDHLGALPYFTEVCGYRGPILMTYPTFAIAPIILGDYVKVNADRPGERMPYNEQHVRDCLRRVTAVDLHQVVSVAPGLSFTFHYAGHVLGAAMVHMRAGHLTAVYTGDFNSSPDRHLGPAELLLPSGGPAAAPWRRPDVLISEATYAASLRDSKRARERDLLTAVTDTVAAGGKVLIPTFAMGRAQELLMLITDCWERNGLQVPIYFSSAMASRALVYYQLLLNWTNANVRRSIFGGGGAARSPPPPPRAPSSRRRYYHCDTDPGVDAAAAPADGGGAVGDAMRCNGPGGRTAPVPPTAAAAVEEEEEEEDPQGWSDEGSEGEGGEWGQEGEDGWEREATGEEAGGASVAGRGVAEARGETGSGGGGGGDGDGRGGAGPGPGIAARAAASASAVRQHRRLKTRIRPALPPDIKLDGGGGDDGCSSSGGGGGDDGCSSSGGGGGGGGGGAAAAGGVGRGGGGGGGTGGAPPPRSVGVFSEADVYGMFRTLPWDRSLLHAPGPALLFASPGNITSGVSLEAFRAWAGSSKNLLVLAGYQVRGTLGARLEALQNQQQPAQGRRGDAAATVDVPGGGPASVGGSSSSRVEVRCRVKMLAFSAHADLRGILGLVRRCQPRAVVLVHGQREPMEFLRCRIEATLGIECHAPPTGTNVTISPRRDVPLGVRPQLLTAASCAAGTLAAQATAARAAAAAAVAGERGFGEAVPSATGDWDWDQQKGWFGAPSSGRMVPQPLTALPLSGIVVARVAVGQGPQQQQQLLQPQQAPQGSSQGLQGMQPAGAGGGAEGAGGAGGTAGGGLAATQLTLTDAATASRVLLQAHNAAAAAAAAAVAAAAGAPEQQRQQRPVAPFKIAYGCTVHVRLPPPLPLPRGHRQGDQHHIGDSDGGGGALLAMHVVQGQRPAASAAALAEAAVSALRVAHAAMCRAIGGYAASKRLRLDETALTLTLGSFRARLAPPSVPEPPGSQIKISAHCRAGMQGDGMSGDAADGFGGELVAGLEPGAGCRGVEEAGNEATAARFECEWVAADEAVAVRCLQALRSAFGIPLASDTGVTD